MSLSINTNLMARNVARNLGSSYSRLSTSVRRLASGLRVNSAADDAAGLAIRELMRADVTSLHQGMRNANDAISMIQTADGALAVIDEKLIRMKELAEQAATGTYDSTQRLIIDLEFQAMALEIDRIANATDFNSIHLLDGSLAGEHDGSGLNATGKMKIHFGTANDSAEDYYYVEIGDCTLAGLGLRDEAVTTISAVNSGFSGIMTTVTAASDKAAAVLAGDHKYADIGFGPDFSELNNYDGKNALKVEQGKNPKSILDLNMTEGQWYVGMENGRECINTMFIIPAGTKNFVFNQIGSSEHGTQDNDIQLFTKDGKHLAGTSPVPNYNKFGVGQYEPCDLDYCCTYMGFTIDQYDPAYINTGPTKYDKGETLFFSSYNGMNIGFSDDYTRGHFTPYCSYEVLTIDEVTEDLILWLPGQAGALFQYFTDQYRNPPNPPDPPDPPDPGPDPDPALPQGDIISIKTQDKAQQALERIDNAIVKKDNVRAHLGALQNRLENTVSNLSIQAENLQASESRISDTDVATEMTEFVRSQILSQTGVAMLAQANSLPRMLASLIEG